MDVKYIHLNLFKDLLLTCNGEMYPLLPVPVGSKKIEILFFGIIFNLYYRKI